MPHINLDEVWKFGIGKLRALVSAPTTIRDEGREVRE
jgi:hypothetical protein